MTSTTTTAHLAGSPEWHAHNHAHAVNRAFQPITSYSACDWDVCVEYREWLAGDQRTCVVCTHPIVGGGELAYRHLDYSDDHLAQPTYQVGDPDPTPDLPECGDTTDMTCPATWEDRFFCTWPENHVGKPHVAGTGTRIAAVWE